MSESIAATTASAQPATGAPDAPSADAAPAQPAPDAKAPQNAIEAILAKRQAKEAAAAKESEQAAADKPAEGEPSKDGSDKPAADKPSEVDKGLSLKHAQLKADHRKALAEKEALKAEHAAAAKERDEIKAMFGPSGNPLRALEKLTGKSFKEIMEAAAQGKYDERNVLPDDVQQKLNAFEEWKKQQEAEKEQQKQAAARAEDEGVAAEFIAANKDKYPLFALSGFAAEEIVERAYAELQEGKQPDLDAIARACEEQSAANLEQLLGNAELLGVLAKRPRLRQHFLQALGLSENTAARPASQAQGSSGSGTGPRTLSHATTQESPVPPESPAIQAEEEDWLAGAKARLAQYKQHGRIGR